MRELEEQAAGMLATHVEAMRRHYHGTRAADRRAKHVENMQGLRQRSARDCVELAGARGSTHHHPRGTPTRGSGGQVRIDVPPAAGPRRRSVGRSACSSAGGGGMMGGLAPLREGAKPRSRNASNDAPFSAGGGYLSRGALKTNVSREHSGVVSVDVAMPGGPPMPSPRSSRRASSEAVAPVLECDEEE
jgi:hypothetical protein